MIGQFQLWDAMTNDGKGRSDRKTSGALGWGESSFLRNYMLCYCVTHDAYWLDKIVDHFDRMIASLSDPDGNGYLGWQSVVYSVGITRAAAVGDVGGLTIGPPLQRPWIKRGGTTTGNEYRIELTSPAELVVRDETEDKEIARHAYESPLVIADVPGAKLTMKGKAKAGAKFAIKTVAPESIEYQVHDGMVTYPIAQFIEVVYGDPTLHERYMKKAEAYASLIAEHFFEKWEKTWVDLPDGSGLYKFTPHETQRFPNTSLPHNQYLAPARTWLVLQDVRGLPQREQYRDRVTKMAKYFKKHLRLKGNAYVWRYWDPLPGETHVRSRSSEDIGHGSIDIGFVVEAWRRGIVFTDEDIGRFANTYVDVMWNGDKENPRFGSRVDTNKGNKPCGLVWMRLGEADPRVWELAWSDYPSNSHSPSRIPSVLALYERLVGVGNEARAECGRRTQGILDVIGSAAPGLINGGFEFGTVGSRLVPGWNLTAWSPDEGGEAKCVAGGHDGKQSIALIGKGPKVNVLAQCMKQIPVAGKTTCTVEAYYRTDGTPKPHMSILGYDAKGKRIQYTSSSSFPPSESWRQAAWPAKIKEGVEAVAILLRNGGPGTVYWDEVEVEVK